MYVKSGSGSPLYLTMQKRYETEVNNLSQTTLLFLQCISTLQAPLSFSYQIDLQV